MTYRVELLKTDDGYTVGCPALPGCWSEGDTEEQALTNIRNVISGYLDRQVALESAHETRFVDVVPKTKPKREIKPFKVEPFSLGLPPEWTSHKVEDLLDILEGPERKW